MLAAVAGELQQALLTGKVEKIMQPDPLTIVLTIYHAGEKHHLLISCEPNSPRIYLTHDGRRNPPTPPNFCMLLRKYLEGAWVQAIEHPFGLGERVVRLDFLGRDHAHYFLWIELMGKHSNVIFTDSAGIILGALKRVTMEMSRFREVRAGIPYAPPPRQKGSKRDPFAPGAGNDLPQETLPSPDDAQKWLLATFTAISPLMAQETIARLAKPPYSAEAIWYALNDLLNSARLGEWSPRLILGENGHPEGAYPIALKSVPEARQQRWKSISSALDRAYAELGEEDAFRQERDSLLSALRRAVKAREREMIDIEEGLANSERAEEYKENAHLIQSNIGAIAEGAREARLPDYYAEQPGALRAIEVDPRLSAQQNAERYIRRYQKARDAAEALAERKRVIGALLESLSAAETRIASAKTLQDLAAISQEIAEERSMRPPKSEKADEPSPFAGHKIRTYTSVDGWEILVGENATSNDFLTTRVASPSDIWLHARAVPSAHAIIRTRNRPVSVSPAALRLAAEQVARRSQAKHARLVPVDYTLKKYVRKPRRAAPGEVTYSHEKTVDVVPVEADSS